MIRVGILGASGYTALELIKILLRHDRVRITALTSRQEGNLAIGTLHPQLNRRLDMSVEDLSPEQVAERADCVFSCLPHGASADAVSKIIDAGRRAIDFSADYRLDDADVFAHWYGQPHHDPARVGKVIYGLPELNRERIQNADLVANPGCYPTSAILALAPLLKGGMVETADIIVDSASGVSGAGRTPKLNVHYPECNENFSAYGVGQHRHTPEIDQVLSTAAGKTVNVIFTPHLVPMDRGILTTTYSRPTRNVSQAEVLGALREFYANEPFVRVVEHLPGTKDVAHGNFCDITARVVRDRIVTVSCIDNLVKGASGQAVQNFNLMYGLDETKALL